MTREDVKDQMRSYGADEYVIAELMEAVDSMPAYGMMSMFCCVPDFMLAVGFCKKVIPGVETPLHPTSAPVQWLAVSSSPAAISPS